MHLLILLIDERPEEVTDIKEAITGENVEVIYSTFDELPEHHRRVSEMVIVAISAVTTVTAITLFPAFFTSQPTITSKSPVSARTPK